LNKTKAALALTDEQMGQAYLSCPGSLRTAMASTQEPGMEKWQYLGDLAELSGWEFEDCKTAGAFQGLALYAPENTFHYLILTTLVIQ